MNKLIFDQGKVLIGQPNVMDLKQKILQNYKNVFKSDLKLYISEGIKKLIIDATLKLKSTTN